jgi:hypothetical protein
MNADDYNVSPKGPYYFSQIRVDPGNDQHILVTQDGYRRSLDGGRTWNTPVFPRMFGDYRTLWIDPENPNRMIAGSDASITISYDGGRTSDHYANIPVGEIYSVGFDMDDPYNLYAGLQDHEHWKGPSNGPLGRVPWTGRGRRQRRHVYAGRPDDSRALHHAARGHTRVDQKPGYERTSGPSDRGRSVPLPVGDAPPHLAARSTIMPAPRCSCVNDGGIPDQRSPRPEYEPKASCRLQRAACRAAFHGSPLRRFRNRP